MNYIDKYMKMADWRMQRYRESNGFPSRRILGYMVAWYQLTYGTGVYIKHSPKITEVIPPWKSYFYRNWEKV